MGVVNYGVMNGGLERRESAQIVPEAELKPEWVPVGRMADEGTIGHDLVAACGDLAVRKRASTTFNQRLNYLWPGGRQSRVLTELQARGLRTVGDILGLNEEMVVNFTYCGEIKERLVNYLADLRILPHTKLLNKVFLDELSAEMAFPPEREDEIVSAVTKALDLLNPKQRLVLNLRYGLIDGINRTMEEVRKDATFYLGSKQAVGGLEDTAGRRLLGKRGGLSDYLIVSPDSFGYRILGAVLRNDLGQGFPLVGQLLLSDEVRGELAGRNDRLLAWDSRKFLLTPASELSLSEKTFQEIAQELVRTSEEEKARVTVSIFEDEFSRIIRQEPYKRPLLGVELTRDKTRKLDDDGSLEWLEMSTRAYKILKGVGKGSAREIGERLEERLVLPRGVLVEKFVSYFTEKGSRSVGGGLVKMEGSRLGNSFSARLL